jgi:hypothetical protein
MVVVPARLTMKELLAMKASSSLAFSLRKILLE